MSEQQETDQPDLVFTRPDTSTITGGSSPEPSEAFLRWVAGRAIVTE